MACPPPDLVLFSGTGDPLPEGSGWTIAKLDEHVLGCSSCRREVDAFRRSVARYSSVDVIDADRFDAAFFDELSREVDAAMGVEARPAQVVPLQPPRRTSSWIVAAAAGLVLAVGLWQLRPQPAELQAEGAPPKAEAAPEAEAVAAEPDLEEQARALGRAWLAEALEEDDPATEALFAGFAPDGDDPGYAFAGTWMDDLDELQRDELTSLFTRL